MYVKILELSSEEKISRDGDEAEKMYVLSVFGFSILYVLSVCVWLQHHVCAVHVWFQHDVYACGW